MNQRKVIVAFGAIIISGCAAGPQPISLSAPQYLPSSGSVSVPEHSPAPSACDSVTGGVIKTVNIADIAAVLRAGDFTKKEFETTDEYNKRTKPKVDEAMKLAKSMTGRHKLLFAIPIKNELKYDADRGLGRIGSNATLLGTEFGSAGHYIVVSSTHRVVGSYVGTNAFGVSKEVIKSETAAFGVRFPGITAYAWPREFQQFEFPLNASDARKAKENLAVLIVGTLRPPYLSQETGGSTAKIDYPFEERLKADVVELDVTCAAVYNGATGEIVKEIDFKRSRY